METARLLSLSEIVDSTPAQRRDVTMTEEKYQLQIRVDEHFHKYLEMLVVRAGVETTSELIRLSLRELDKVRNDYDGIQLPGNVVICADKAELNSTEQRVVKFRKKSANRRINVVLRGVAVQRLKRLIEWSGNLPLVDLVAIALGVLDKTLVTEEEELSRSSSVNRPASFWAEA